MTDNSHYVKLSELGQSQESKNMPMKWAYSELIMSVRCTPGVGGMTRIDPTPSSESVRR